MKFLSHHEFGLDQKKFQFKDTKKNNSFENSDINYWVDQWVNVYSNMLKISANNKNVFLINYENLCEHPEKILSPILLKFNISKNDIKNFKFNKSEKKIYEKIDSNLKKIS